MSQDSFYNFSEKSLFEDVIDDVSSGLDSDFRSEAGNFETDDFEIDDALDDQELSIRNYDYIVNILTVDMSSRADQERMKFLEGFINESKRRFNRMFCRISRIRRHSPVHFFLGD